MTDESGQQVNPPAPDPPRYPPIVTGRGLAAVLAGFLAMAFVSVVATWGLLLMKVGGSEGTALGLNVASSFVAAVLGGYVAGTVGRSRPLLDAAGLALVIAVMGGWGIVTGAGQEGVPTWYPWAVTALGMVGALLGGVLRQARGIPKSSEEKLQEAFDSVLFEAMNRAGTDSQDSSPGPNAERSGTAGTQP